MTWGWKEKEEWTREVRSFWVYVVEGWFARDVKVLCVLSPVWEGGGASLGVQERRVAPRSTEPLDHPCVCPLLA